MIQICTDRVAHTNRDVIATIYSKNEIQMANTITTLFILTNIHVKKTRKQEHDLCIYNSHTDQIFFMNRKSLKQTVV